MKSKIIQDLEATIIKLQKQCDAQNRAIQILTEQRNDAYIEQANKMVMFKVNSLQPQSGTP